MYSYDPLWETMRKKGITTYYLIQHGLEKKTIYNLQHHANVTVLTLEKLCKILDCEVSDILRIEFDKE